MGIILNLVQRTIKNKLVFVFIVFCLSVIWSANISAATSAVGFNAGRIIDDTVFTNSNSMNVSQIQAFLNSKVSICDNWGTNGSTSTSRRDFVISHGYSLPMTCLKDYQENGITTAQIIYNAAQTYSINPQVLIVLLQKEQSLVTDDWPTDNQYRSATGYGCPDTAPCDSQYYGLTNQINWSAHMFRAILNSSPTWWSPYVLGNNNIQWSPNAACGSSVVYIQNRSTQALYDYTPYQPNQAALDAGYGGGDSCSSHGNRNFYLFFNDWFGSTLRTLVKESGGGVYLVENNTKRTFPDEITFLSYSYKWSDVLTVNSEELALIPDGAVMDYNVNYRDGQLITANGDGVYLIENGTKRPIQSIEAFYSNHYNWNGIKPISSEELGKIPDGTAISYNTHFRDGQLIISPSYGVYLLENGLKRPFPSAATFLSHLYKWSDIVPISSSELSLITDGATMSYNIHYRDGQLVTADGGGVSLIENGTKRPIQSIEAFYSNHYNWNGIKPISSEELGKIPDGTAISYNTHFRDGQLIISPSYGVYLVENGLKRPFPSAAVFLSYSYKWSDIVPISSIELSLVPDGITMP